MDEKKKRKISISICLIVVLILVIIGISYAAFTFVGQGNKVNQITTGTIQMNYEEGSNVIRLNNALPTTDATGKVRLVDGEYFDFSVTTNITGDALINWEIAAEDFDGNTFDGSNVKFYLTKIVDGNEVEVSSSLPAVYSEKTSENKKTGRPANMMSLLTGSISTQGEEITNYRLRLYVDEKYNPQGDGGGLIFKTRINVYGKVDTEKKVPMMKSYAVNYDNTDYHISNYKDNITSVVTKDNTNIPATAIEVTNGKGNYWDVSVDEDDSVIAYIEDDGMGASTYKLTIGGKGKITANQSSNNLFFKFINLKSANLSFFDTSKVTNMNSMFSGCINLTSLDISSFDTSNVTTMSYMFGGGPMTGGCVSLTNLDVSHFNTSKVTDMSYMFIYCESLENLDLSNFDTSNVTNMYCMFEDCKKLITLDVSSFRTTKVTNMWFMFSGCSSLTTIDVSHFDTSNQTSFLGMFAGCSSLTTIDVSHFDTSNVTIMTGMFSNCRGLTSLDVSNFDMSNVTSIENMFYGCSNLTSIVASNKWQISETANVKNCFTGCGIDHVTIM